MQGRNELDERLPSVDAFWGAGTEEDHIRGEDLFQPREIFSVQQIKVVSDQTVVLFEVRWHISLSPSRGRQMDRLPWVIGPPNLCSMMPCSTGLRIWRMLIHRSAWKAHSRKLRYPMQQ